MPAADVPALALKPAVTNPIAALTAATGLLKPPRMSAIRRRQVTKKPLALQPPPRQHRPTTTRSPAPPRPRPVSARPWLAKLRAPLLHIHAALHTVGAA